MIAFSKRTSKERLGQKPEQKPVKVKKQSSSAQQLRILLSALLVVALLSSALLYFFALDKISSFATEVNNRTVDATASAKQIQELQSLKSQVDRDENLVARVDSIFALPEDYQAQAIRDIQHYAQLSGIGSSKINFENSTNQQSTERPFTVEFSEAVPFDSLLKFLTAVESSIPKMEVENIKIDRATNSPDSVSVENLRISIHVK